MAEYSDEEVVAMARRLDLPPSRRELNEVHRKVTRLTSITADFMMAYVTDNKGMAANQLGKLADLIEEIAALGRQLSGVDGTA